MKTKTLISFAVTVKLICVIVFAYEKSRFTHAAADLISAIVCPYQSEDCVFKILEFLVIQPSIQGFAGSISLSGTSFHELSVSAERMGT